MYWLIDGSPVPFWGVQFEHEVTQSDWITILEQIGYRRILLLEFDMPGPQGSSTYAQALDYFERAQKRYLEQDSGLPTWCESPCGPQRWGFGLEPPDEVDAG